MEPSQPASSTVSTAEGGQGRCEEGVGRAGFCCVSVGQRASPLQPFFFSLSLAQDLSLPAPLSSREADVGVCESGATEALVPSS